MTLLLLNLIAALGGFVVGLSGFGFVLLCVPLFALLIDVKLAIVASAFMGWSCTLPIAYKMRQQIQYRAVAVLLVGAVPGSMIGAALLHEVPSEYVLIAMSLVIITSSTYCLQLRKTQKRASNPPTTIMVGLASGVLGSSVGEAGPPIVSYSVMQPWTAEQAKATMIGFFAIQMAAALASFTYEGLLTLTTLEFIARLLPGLIVGVIIGLVSFNAIQQRGINYQRYMHFALILIAAYLLATIIF
jgi:uncharacterized membrane protein YfcA